MKDTVDRSRSLVQPVGHLRIESAPQGVQVIGGNRDARTSFLGIGRKWYSTDERNMLYVPR